MKSESGLMEEGFLVTQCTESALHLCDACGFNLNNFDRFILLDIVNYKRLIGLFL